MKHRRLRILFLINNLAGGGAERVLVNLVNNLDPSKYEVTLRTLFDEGDNKNHIRSFVRYEYVFRKSFRGVNILGFIPGRLVYDWVARGRYDVVVPYMHGVLTRIVASAPTDQKTIAYLHANMQRSPFMKSFKTRERIQRCFGSYNAIVSVSRDVQESFSAVSGMHDRLHVLHNVFDTESIKRKAIEDVDPTLFAGSLALNICSIGKLTDVKGYDRLLRVAGKLRAEGFNFKLLIVGDGPQREALSHYIDEVDLAESVSLVGYDQNPYKYLARCDLFVSSSYSEGFSSVVVESIVLGVPVLATDCSGMREILGDNNEYGLVVDNSEEGLLSGLRLLIKDKNLLDHYRARAARRAPDFASGLAVGKFEELIGEVMRDGPRS